MLFGFSVYAQKIGIRGGLNLVTTGSDSKNISMKSDYHIGLFWSDSLAKKLICQIDATYSRQGGQGNPSLFEDFKFNHNYLNISTLVGLKLSNRLQIHLGPQMGIKINGRIKWNGFINENITDDLSFLNLSLASELQCQIADKISFYTRYAHGLTSNVSRNNTTEGRFPDRVIQLGIAVNLGNI